MLVRRHGYRRARSVGLTVAALVALPIASCGGESDGKGIRTVVRELQTALAAGDLETACGLMTEDAHEHIGAAGHDPPKTCERDLVLIYKGLKKGGGLDRYADRKIVRVERDGDRAQATLDVGQGGQVVVPLANGDGGWKVDALYGDLPAGQQEDNFK